MAACEQIRVT